MADVFENAMVNGISFQSNSNKRDFVFIILIEKYEDMQKILKKLPEQYVTS